MMPEIKVTLSIGFAGATHEDVIEIDDDEWNYCKTEKERNDLMYDYWKDWSGNYIDGGPELIDK